MIRLLTAALLAAAPESPVVEPATEPEVPRRPLTPPADAPAPAQLDEDLGEHPPKEGPGSQWGFVGLLAATVNVGLRTTVDPLSQPRTRADVVGFSGIGAAGARYGFKPREANRMWMPGAAFLVGSSVAADGFSPFVEGRAELMSVSEGGALQPNFVVYGATGVGLTALGNGRPVSARPHVGFGLGWNWLPKGGGSFAGGWGGGWWGGGGGLGAAVALPVALGIVAMIFAGRVEVRYTARPVTGPGSDFVSVVLGVGG